MNGRVPRYLQIADTLRERLRRGELPPGVRLETQRALARRFDVTLMTLAMPSAQDDLGFTNVDRHGL